MEIKKQRFEALDMLRGLSMVIMALDHSRDFFALGFVYFAPLDIDITTLEVFFTRWITNFAAPTFIFLAGIGLFFASGRRTKSELAYLAITRGMWLIFLELTFVGFFWSFNSEFILHPKIAVLFVIGACMIFMGLLIYLPKYMIAIIAIFMIFGHNFFDEIQASSFGTYAWVWQVLHVKGIIFFEGGDIRVIYPFIPWIGVMATGYLFGPITKMEQASRKKIFAYTGLSLVIFAIILRYFDSYGNLTQWMHYGTLKQTIMSFLNFTKYPPSLTFLSFFMGMAMLLLSIFDRKLGSWANPLKYFGQVPFFFYVTHLPILHLGGIILAYTVFGDASWLFGAPMISSPEGYSYGYNLFPTYVAWILVVLALYLPSKWFAELKSKRKDWWLSYL